MAQKLFRVCRQRYLENKITALDGGIEPKTLIDFWEEYQEYRLHNASKFSCQTDRQAFRVFIKALGADTRLTRITQKQIETSLASLGKEVSRVRANTWFRHFKAALSKAVSWGYLNGSPCQGIKQLRTHGDFPRFLTEEEFDRLLATEAEPLFRLFWQFQVYGGARRSESLGITTKDVDWGMNRISIGRTKNGKPKFIVITKKIRGILKALGQDVGRLWSWQPDTVTHHFNRTARAAGLKCRLHDLRHTYGSWLVMRGVPLYTVGKLMGHQDAKTTQIYAHLSQDHLEEAAGKL